MTNKEDIKYFNWLKYLKLYFVISLTVIGCGLIAILKWGLPLGLDFTGGAVVEYKVSDLKQAGEIETRLKDGGVEVRSVQTSGGDHAIFKTKNIDNEKQKLTADLATELNVERVQIQNVGPTVGPELIKKTIIAILISTSAILLWVATQFKKLNFGLAATLATLHDSLVLIGTFAILGHIFGAEIDFLFVTALLTTLSFSVHDTIVVFDRIREIQRKHGGELKDVINRSVSETMRRSIINSLTIIMMLLALTVFGGDSIRWFGAALLIGAITGTYSSPFVAIPLYYVFTNLQKRVKKR